MGTYMIQGSYTSETWAALVKNPEDRGAAVKKLTEALGGRMLDIYYCFGEYDFVVIFEIPDDVTTMAAILAAVAPGHLKATKTTKLLTMEEAMEAMEKAGKLVYAAPKG